MTTRRSEAVEEHARILLLLGRDAEVEYRHFWAEMRQEYPSLSLHVIAEIWTDYMGWDGAPPRKDMETGRWIPLW